MEMLRKIKSRVVSMALPPSALLGASAAAGRWLDWAAAAARWLLAATAESSALCVFLLPGHAICVVGSGSAWGFVAAAIVGDGAGGGRGWT
jgi:hypothetical protein